MLEFVLQLQPPPPVSAVETGTRVVQSVFHPAYTTMTFTGEHTTAVTSSLDPHAIVSARWVYPGVLLVAYQDGQSYRVGLEKLVGSSLVPGLVADSARPSEFGSAVIFDRTDGNEYHVDATAIRAMFDPLLARQIGEEKDRTAVAVGERIASVRGSKKVTLAHLARQSGLSANTVREFESGKALPSYKALIAIATAMGVSFSDLLPTEE